MLYSVIDVCLRYFLYRNEYKIQKSSYIPSVYGDNKLEFPGDSREGVIIESKPEAYSFEIRNAIEKYEEYTKFVMPFTLRYTIYQNDAHF